MLSRGQALGCHAITPHAYLQCEWAMVGTVRAKAASLKRAILVLVNEFKQLIVGTDAALAKLS